jgi:hypothetical protein
MLVRKTTTQARAGRPIASEADRKIVMTVSLTTAQRARLVAEADRRQIGVSELVREALACYWARADTDAVTGGRQ